MYWLLIGCLAVILWPSFALWNERTLTEADLVAVSPRYYGIGDKFLLHIAAEIPLFALALLPLFLGSILDDSQRSSVGPFTVVAAFVGHGWKDAWFAYRLGVYPTARYHGSRTQFTYSATDRVRRVAKYQLALTTAVIAAVIMSCIWVVFL